jgi:lipopolysaccharide transport system ATP-binding protein
MTRDWSIKAEGVSKKFGQSLKSSMRYGLRDSFAQILGRRVAGEELREGEFWAVKDVSFELKRGDSLGIMGVNGSGKSTLLRILTGVYRPDTGRVMMRGTTGALIAAGAGFAPMLTGRENIYVNGALLGMSRATVAKRFDEIIAFAELEGFLDMPVKNYSSGMVVRLGFAIAAMSEPDILIVDEVLAVGDINFQKKCYDYLFRLRRAGATIILVSHSVGAVWAVCDRAIFMDRGSVLVSGAVEEVIRAYEDQNSRAAMLSAQMVESIGGQWSSMGDAANVPDDGALAPSGPEVGAKCSKVSLTNTRGLETREFAFEEDFIFSVDVENLRAIDNFVLRLVIDAAHYRNICSIDSYENGFKIMRLDAGYYRFQIHVRKPNLRPGVYSISIAVVSKNFGLHLFLAHSVASFVIMSPTDRFFYSDPTAVLQLDADFSCQSRSA